MVRGARGLGPGAWGTGPEAWGGEAGFRNHKLIQKLDSETGFGNPDFRNPEAGFRNWIQKLDSETHRFRTPLGVGEEPLAQSGSPTAGLPLAGLGHTLL